MDRQQNEKHSPHEHDHENRDPITGAPGAHPVGAGVGAAGGGAAGAAIGAVAGPVGAVVGAAIGGIAGGLLGKGVAEGVNPTDEDVYWRANYPARPYAKPDTTYDAYGPAYQYGWESFFAHGTSGRSFDEVEPELRREWEAHRGEKDLDWEQARDATRDAWHRMASRGESSERPDRL